MSPTTASQSLPAVPLEVLEFATEQGVVPYLRPLLTMTRGIFPDESIRLRLEEDPESADQRTIAVEVDVTDWTVAEMLAAHNQWSEQLFRVCPATKVCAFRIGMVQTL